VDLRWIECFVEPEALGDLPVGRVAQHGLAATHQHRHVERRDLEAIQQHLHVGVAVEVEVGIGMRIAGEEFLHPQRSGAVIRANDDGIADSLRDELHAAQDESPHEDLADLGVGLHQRQQVFAAHLDHFTGLADTGPHQRAAPGEHVDLARKLPRAEQGEPLFPARGGSEDLDLSRGDEKEGRHRIAGLVQHLAALWAAGGHARPPAQSARQSAAGRFARRRTWP
jgi:hypothetical protein